MNKQHASLPEKSITFVSAFYPIRSKFSGQKYMEWASNLFSIVRHFYLVVFTDTESYKPLLDLTKNNPKIRIVIRPMSEFHGIKYAEFWKKNHEKNFMQKTNSWELNMLWNEKVWFVNEAIQTEYFPETEYYGWVDIGYFRNNSDNVHTSVLKEWGNYNRVSCFSVQKVHYTLVNPIGFRLLQNLRGIKIPVQQTAVAGGFFLGGKEALLKWRDIFTEKVEHYVSQEKLLRDDQTIIVDCLLNMEHNFPVILHEGNRGACDCPYCQQANTLYTIHTQNGGGYNENYPFPLSCCHSSGLDDWFLFQRLLA